MEFCRGIVRFIGVMTRALVQDIMDGSESEAHWDPRPIGLALLEAIKMATCEKSIGKRASAGDPNHLARLEALVHPQRREPSVRERIELAIVAHDLQRRHTLREELTSEDGLGIMDNRHQ